MKTYLQKLKEKYEKICEKIEQLEEQAFKLETRSEGIKTDRYINKCALTYSVSA